MTLNVNVSLKLVNNLPHTSNIYLVSTSTNFWPESY